MRKYPVKKYAVIGACGLDCGLCPRYHSDGEKPCPGCCGEGFWERHPGCAHITCCVKQRGLEVCGECNELEFCPRVMRNLEAAKHADSVISYQTLPGNLEVIRRHGLEAFLKHQEEKVAFLRLLLAGYNDGRSKGFYCLCVQLLSLDGLRAALAGSQLKFPPQATLKEKARVVREAFSLLAGESGIELKLRTPKPH
jgi:hypothetical protein